MNANTDALLGHSCTLAAVINHSTHEQMTSRSKLALLVDFQHRHVLLSIASSCLFLQAGDKVKALKCLIRSGDTDKIIFFAGVSRHAEIYTLAANYLQTLDWHARPDLAQSIVTFYSKVSSCTPHALKHAAATRDMVNADKG